jgi:hypothetical protein
MNDHRPIVSVSRNLRLVPIALAGALVLFAGGAGRGQAPQLPPGYSAKSPKVNRILREMSIDSMAVILKRMEAFGTRNTLSDTVSETRGIGAARRWIHRQFRSYSPRLQVFFQSETTPAETRGRLPGGTTLVNVVAVLPGTHPVLKEQHIVVGGHYDSINLDPPREGDTWGQRDADRPAPGVNDDISGVATAMEMARVCSKYEFDKTLVFIAFVAEEQGLLGAGVYARRARADSQAIEAFLNMDMIGNSVRGGGAPSRPRTVRVFSEDPMDSPSRQIARYLETIGERYVPDMDVDLIFRLDRFGRGGDHTAFNREGYPAVRLVEANEDYDKQHSYNDTAANLDLDYLIRNARIEAATAFTLADAPSAPVPMRLGRGGGYDAQVQFQPPMGEVTGYVVAVRATTSPRWEHFYWVAEPEKMSRGERTWLQITLPQLDIDEVVIGVGALGRDGYPSLIAPFLR